MTRTPAHALTQLLVLRHGTPDGARRAARLLSEVIRQSSLLCRTTAHSTLLEALQRLKVNALVDDSEGRLTVLDTQVGGGGVV